MVVGSVASSKLSRAGSQARLLEFAFSFRCRLDKFSRTGSGAGSTISFRVQVRVQARLFSFAYRFRCRLDYLVSRIGSGAGSTI